MIKMEFFPFILSFLIDLSWPSTKPFRAHNGVAAHALGISVEAVEEPVSCHYLTSASIGAEIGIIRSSQHNSMNIFHRPDSLKVKKKKENTRLTEKFGSAPRVSGRMERARFGRMNKKSQLVFTWFSGAAQPSTSADSGSRSRCGCLFTMKHAGIFKGIRHKRSPELFSSKTVQQF